MQAHGFRKQPTTLQLGSNTQHIVKTTVSLQSTKVSLQFIASTSLVSIRDWSVVTRQIVNRFNVYEGQGSNRALSANIRTHITRIDQQKKKLTPNTESSNWSRGACHRLPTAVPIVKFHWIFVKLGVVQNRKTLSDDSDKRTIYQPQKPQNIEWIRFRWFAVWRH